MKNIYEHIRAMKWDKTSDQIANEINVSKRTVQRLMDQGLPFRKIGRSPRFCSEEVWNWIGGNKNKRKKTLDL